MDLPIFNGGIGHWEAVTYLREIKLFLKFKVFTWEETKYTIHRSFERKADDWWYIYEKYTQSFEDFEREFRKRFRNSAVFDKITRKMEFGTYEPESKKTKVEYTKELLDQAGYFTLEDEKEIVKILAKHYNGSIRIAVIMHKIVDYTAFLRLLARRDEKDYIKRRKLSAFIFNGEIWERPIRFLK